MDTTVVYGYNSSLFKNASDNGAWSISDSKLNEIVQFRPRQCPKILPDSLCAPKRSISVQKADESLDLNFVC